MNTNIRCAESTELLERFLDGELSDAAHAGMSAHLATCELCSRRLESQAALTRSLKEGLVRYTAPDVLKARIHSALIEASDSSESRDTRESSDNGEGNDNGDRIERPVAPTSPTSPTPARRAQPAPRRWPLLAAGAALVLLSNVATYSLSRATFESRATATEVLTSHVRSLMPGHLVDVASTNQHNVKPWFNGRTALSPPVPSLETLDFHLIGGRLDYVAGQRAAVVVYGRRLHTINVYAWPHAGGDTPQSSRSEQGYHFVTWHAGGMEFWVVSDLNATELADFIRAYRQGDTAR